MDIMKELVDLSNFYGKDPEFVLAGGGNTSAKVGDELYVKGSGAALAAISAEGFVRMDRAKLKAVVNGKYSKDADAREKEVLAALYAARAAGEEHKRPSVETSLHDMLDFTFVLHVHPALVNGMTCSQDGKKTAAALFPDAAWVNATKAGYILAVDSQKVIDAYVKKRGKQPAVLFIENHGVFFGADSRAALDKLVSGVMGTLRGQVKIKPEFIQMSAQDIDDELNLGNAARAAAAIRTVYGKFEGSAVTTYVLNWETLHFAESRGAFSAVEYAFTPDHIVYCKHKALYLEDAAPDAVNAAFAAYHAENKFAPKIVFVKGLGMFASGKNVKEANAARDVFLDEIKIAVYARSFGGGKFMTAEDIDFILHWEVENYRQKVSVGAGGSKRLSQKVVIVTGGAQGFGRGIAEQLAKEGALLVVADLNYEGASATARQIEDINGTGTAYAVKADVSDEASVAAMVDSAVLKYGGADVFISCAGVVKSGGLDELDVKSFEFVTKINYTAYFLCVKYTSRIMKIQHAADPSKYYDIIQINSKSGLSGSNKNFAYAGSKFGGIGLTQSFALELVPYNIKVNAVCPGNLMDGPLWTDPEKGLLVQYLRAGKVPGAKTIEDVRRFYDAKVPMGRGCREIDVVRAILYIVEQEYETGQAVPVTGGQEMLK
ncbi:hypothetical protein FACS1894211_09920 [Clostridia bacterium]|nr:hypothetical protein FACS1894211_09920 [Clostridia bacterium]